ncbi:MAG: MMPL family transporter [Proteobacteria bacterium]|nr:MMPL family transporter [Pseudomonadota bacterium]
MGAAGYQAVDERTQEILGRHDATGQYAGLAAVAGQDQDRILRNVGRIIPLGMIVVLLLLRAVERRPLQVIAVGVPMVLASVATVGALGFALGEISVMESFFGVMVFGLGVDFALHLLVRLREEREEHPQFSEALRRTLAGAGPGIVAGGLTTAGAFAILALAPDASAQHLGLSGAVGLAICGVLMLTLLPALWTLLERRGAASVQTALRVPGLPALAAFSVRHPWKVVTTAVVLCAVALAGLPRSTYQTDLEKVFTRDLPAFETADRIQEIWGADTQPWIVLTDSLEEARSVAAALQADPTFAAAHSLGTLLPADLERREAELRAAAPRLQQNQLVLSLTGSAALNGTLLQAALDGAPTLEDVPDSLAEGWRTDSGRWVVRAYPEPPTLDGVVAKEHRLAAQAIAPQATSMGVVLEQTMGGDRPWLKWLFAGILAFVLAVLAADLRSARWVGIAVAPVVFGTVCCVGVFCWVGLPFNVDTVLVLPLLIGLGVDDGIHVVHRIVHRIRQLGSRVGADTAAVSVGRAIFMTTCTTIASLTAFLLSEHQGLESLALVLIVGLPLCLLATVMLVPVLASLLGQESERGQEVEQRGI